VAIGDSALYKNGIGVTISTEAIQNTAIGSKALSSNTTGSYNTATGFESLKANTTGTHNVATGSGALILMTTGAANTAIGTEAGNTITTGNFNTLLGRNADVTSANQLRSTAIGYGAVVGCDNCLVLGGTGGNAVNVGIGLTNPAAELDVNGYSKLGPNSPIFQIKKLTGTTAASQGSSVNVAHGLTASKILSVVVLVEYSASSYIHHSYMLNPGYEFNYYITSSNITVANISGNSASILSNPFKIIITYEQ
jgi:hypothetical protein